MEKPYYTLTEATDAIGKDAATLGELGLLPMAYRLPEADDTQNTSVVIDSHIKPGYASLRFGYITPDDFYRVANATRNGDKAILHNIFATIEQLSRADAIIKLKKQGVGKLITKLVQGGVKYKAAYASLADIYVTAEAMAAYKASESVPTDAPDEKIEAEQASELQRKIKTKAKQQEEEILRLIRDALFTDPLELPRVKKGSAGTKSTLRSLLGIPSELFPSIKTFNTAWERLRSMGEIKDSD
jgi:hypothetical protein